MDTLSDKARAFSVDFLLAENGTDKYGSIQAELCCRELWAKFNAIGTEMIITKAGRRMFPAVKVRFRGLEPATPYVVFMDIVPVDNNRYKYLYHNCEWTVGGTGEGPPPAEVIYVHPDSPSPGRFWMSQEVVTFEKLKLTNNSSPIVKGQIPLHSMHKYIPRVHIVPSRDCTIPLELQTRAETAATFIFPETSFITVTAYQNQKITKLKIESNPFAKGFRETTRTRLALETVKWNGNGQQEETAQDYLHSIRNTQMPQKLSRYQSQFDYIYRKIKLVIPPLENRALTETSDLTNHNCHRNDYVHSLQEI